MSANGKGENVAEASMGIPQAPPMTQPLALSNSSIPLWIAIGSVMLGASVAVGVKYGNRMAEKMETENPPKKQVASRNRPIVTEAQRRTATNKAFLALGLGTVLCATFGAALTIGIKRYYQVDNMPDFARAMRGSVERFNEKHLNPIVASFPSSVARTQTWLHSTSIGSKIKKTETTNDLSTGEANELTYYGDKLAAYNAELAKELAKDEAVVEVVSSSEKR